MRMMGEMRIRRERVGYRCEDGIGRFREMVEVLR